MPEAKAFPRKRFFLEMFTRDIALEDCVMDLIDNSIDSLIRKDKIKLPQIFKATKALTEKQIDSLPTINVEFDSKEFKISDECGGIAYDDAIDDVFNFGHAANYDSKTTGRKLGVYGIGMKRAIFKMGQRFRIHSQTNKDGFEMDIDVKKWAEQDNGPGDWVFPIRRLQGKGNKEPGATKIVVTNFSEDVAGVFSDALLKDRLYRQISTTYALFLNRFVKVKLNDDAVTPIDVPIGYSSNVRPSVEVRNEGGVRVVIAASFAIQGRAGRWETKNAGWYVLCNGRIVVSADKTELTGWGGAILPGYQPKFRGFVGVVSFRSDDPLLLPWTTTKRGLNKDALAYQRVRDAMARVARPVITQLEKFYSSDSDQYQGEKQVADALSQAETRKIVSHDPSTFRVSTNLNKKLTQSTLMEQINFLVEPKDLEKVRKHLRNPSMAKSAVGRHIFEYFMKSEGLR